MLELGTFKRTQPAPQKIDKFIKFYREGTAEEKVLLICHFATQWPKVVECAMTKMKNEDLRLNRIAKSKARAPMTVQQRAAANVRRKQRAPKVAAEMGASVP